MVFEQLKRHHKSSGRSRMRTATASYEKAFERATMTRIGRCQIKNRHLLAMHPTGETISPRSSFRLIGHSRPRSRKCQPILPGKGTNQDGKKKKYNWDPCNQHQI